MKVREDHAWLLKSRVNPLPVPGSLSLSDTRITFTITGSATDAPLDWLESMPGLDGVGQRVQAGQEVVVFECELADCAVTWPITGGGGIMIVRTPAQKWVLSYEHPTGRARHPAFSLISGRRRARDWKQALAELES